MGTVAFPALAIKQPDLLQQVTGALQAKGMIQQQQLGQVQLQQATAQQQSEQALMRIWAENDGDYNATYADASKSGQVLPEHLQNFQIRGIAAQTQAANLTEKQLQNHKAVSEAAANEIDAIKNLPPEKQFQGIKDAVGRLLQVGGPDNAKWLIPIANDLARNPTPENFQRYEVQLMGEQWANANEIKQRELQSMPTVAQAQLKTELGLAQAQDEARMKHVEMLSQPTPEFAHNVQRQNYLKTQAETAKDLAETAKAKADTALVGFDPVIATRPGQQAELMSLAKAKSLGYTETQIDKAGPEDRQKYGQVSSQLAGVQAAISRYRQAESNPNLRNDPSQDKTMAAILSDAKFLGKLSEHFPLLGGTSDVMDQLRTSDRWKELDDEHQQLLATYLTGKVSSIAFQKITTGVGRLPEEGMHLEFEQVPSPLQATSASFQKQLNQYQDRINVAASAIVKVPGVATPAEVRQAIESQKVSPFAQPAPGTGQYRNANGRQMQVGQEAYGMDKRYIGTVSEVFPDGSYNIRP
jgi:hypothetical protein